MTRSERKSVLQAINLNQADILDLLGRKCVECRRPHINCDHCVNPAFSAEM